MKKRLLRRSLGLATVVVALALVPAASALTEQQKVTAPDGFTDDYFGFSVAIDGDTMIVGAPYDDVGGNANRGSAYVFVRSGGVWNFQQQLLAPDGVDNDNFGFTVAISGDSAVVGAPYDDVRYDFGTVIDVGSAYVFVRNPATGTWSFQVQLSDYMDPRQGDYFGWSVAIDGDTVLAGAPDDDVGGNYDQGSAYVFQRSGTSWAQQAQLTAGDGSRFDQFGTSVALDAGTAIVGAQSDSTGNGQTGSAYAFLRSGTIWTQQTPKLVANDGAAGDYFGFSVALSGDTALVGAPYDDVVLSDEGSAYVFLRSGTTWTQQ